MAQKDYDGDLQMFREAPRDVDMRRLVFMRFLVEKGRLEHPAIGPAAGPLVAFADQDAMRRSNLTLAA